MCVTRIDPIIKFIIARSYLFRVQLSIIDLTVILKFSFSSTDFGIE